MGFDAWTVLAKVSVLLASLIVCIWGMQARLEAGLPWTEQKKRHRYMWVIEFALFVCLVVFRLFGMKWLQVLFSRYSWLT
jgi:hypothetical protein